MIITIHEIKDKNLTFNTISETIKYLTSLNQLWTFTHLGGYELMRDGTQIKQCSSHEDAISFLEDRRVFAYYTNEELQSLLYKDFQTDEDVYTFICNWYSNRYDDGGGWGEVECSNITGLLEAIRHYVDLELK